MNRSRLFTVQPEFTTPVKRVAPQVYKQVQSRVESRLKNFIIAADEVTELDTFGQVEIPNYEFQRPPQMTDEEVVMSIVRLADQFNDGVKDLHTSLGVTL